MEFRSMGRLRASQSEEERAALATRVGGLLDTLSAMGQARLLDVAWAKLFERHGTLPGGAFDAGDRRVYEQACGFGRDGNPAKALKPNVRGFRGVNFRQITALSRFLAEMGFLLKGAPRLQPLDAHTWVSTIACAEKELTAHCASLPVNTSSVQNIAISLTQFSRSVNGASIFVPPEERLIPREDLVERIIHTLDEYSHVGITGIAGCGKTVLAMQTARRLKSHGRNVLIYPPEFGRAPVTLSRLILRNVAELALAGVLSATQSQAFAKSIGQYRALWNERGSSSRYSVQDQRSLKSFLKAMKAPPVSPRAFLEAVVAFAENIRDDQLLFDIAALLHGFAIEVVIVVDDIDAGRPLPINPIFGLEYKTGAEGTPCVTKMLSTSRCR